MLDCSDNRSIDGSSYRTRGFRSRAETGAARTSEGLSLIRSLVRASVRRQWGGWGRGRSAFHDHPSIDAWGRIRILSSGHWLLIFLTRVSARLTRRGWISLWRTT